jgi:hypothetical protein
MRTGTLLLLFCLPLAVVGQRPRIVFDAKRHDLGKIEAGQGIVSRTFVFTNKGTLPLSIIDVESSCGCTIPGWSDHPVLPGRSGEITVNLNPANLSSKFNKEIIVYSSGNVATRLRITGEVLAGPTDAGINYPVAVGSLRLSTDTVRLDAGNRSRIIQLFNAGRKSISITSITKPAELVVDQTPVLLLPGLRGNLVFIYTPLPGKERRDARVLLRTSEGLTGIIHVTFADDLPR